jgi:putative redox protein
MTITAQRASKGKVAFNITVGTHTFAADVNAELGGDDLGPSPHDLFDASLAACTALTVKLYAAHKAWPLDDVQVAIERDNSREAAGHYKLTRKVHFAGALDAEQRVRLLEIANKCPIHKLMHSEIEVVTEAV